MWQKNWKSQSKTGSSFLDGGDEDYSVNLDRYLNLVITNFLNALVESTSIEDGFLKSIIYIDRLEGLAISKGYLKENESETYFKKVEEYKTKKNLEEGKQLIKDANIADFRFRLIMQRINQMGDKIVELTL